MAKITTTSSIFQSGYTYLQAVGSDGSDGTIAGRHLKWDFLRILGDQHLPKGDYTENAPYVSASGFNRLDDYVKLYSVKFNGKPFHVKLDLSDNPASYGTIDGKKCWTYELTVDGSLTSNQTTVRLVFTHTAMYDALYAAMGGTNSFDKKEFIKRYGGVIELHADDKLAFYYQFEMVWNNGEQLRVEAIGTPDSLDPQTKQVNLRKKYRISGNPEFFSENTQFVRFDTTAEIQSIYLITYRDFIEGTNGRVSGSWKEVTLPNGGNFALTTSYAEMLTRLNGDGIHAQWPKFNDGSTVKKANYTDRLCRPAYNPNSFNPLNESGHDPLSLQHFIHNYLKLSTTDPKATIVLPSDGPQDETVQIVSSLDMLKLLSLDFHVSRALGLGHIDADSTTGQYVYCMEYVTTAALDGQHSIAKTRTHLFMTLPTSNEDFRLPQEPSLADVTYGATIDNGTNEPTMITDVNGYAPQENMRFININRKPYDHERAFGPFFHEAATFDLSLETQPVAYGIEYKEISETGYRKPEINHNAGYLDNAGIAEPSPILENGGPRMYTHVEEEEGTHVYAAYAINWFSRASSLSNTKQVTTVFPKAARLLPPFNYAAQLIQDEDPTVEQAAQKTLLLTTIAEQEALAAIPDNQDKTMVRTTFDWNHVHNHAHTTVDYAEFFFHEDEPMVVKGKIMSVQMLDADTALVQTGPYNVTSVYPAQEILPVISSGNAAKFVGSLLSTGQSHYVIEGIQNPGNNPKLRIKVLKQTQAMAPDETNQNQFFAQETLELPQVGDLFFVIENMGDTANWDLKHKQRVYLEKHYTNASIGLRYSPTRLVQYGIREVTQGGGNTTVKLHEKLKSSAISGVTVEYPVRKKIADFNGNEINIQGDYSVFFAPGTQVRIFGNAKNDGIYTVLGAAAYNGTTITLSANVPDSAVSGGVLDFTVNRPLGTINTVSNTITMNGSFMAEIDAAHMEFVTESDGTQSRFVTGGISSGFTKQPLLDGQGNGTGFIQLFSSDYTLLPHPDARVSWYKGTIRLTDVSGKKQTYPVAHIGNLTNTPSNFLSLVIQDPGFVPGSVSDPGDTYTLNLNGTSKGNYHPSYRLYLKSSGGLHPVTNAPIVSGVQFKENAILPAANDPMAGNKQTFMAVRSVDVKNNLFSWLSAPSTILAQKITVPVAPALPKGPLYATRPNFYGKSTYTFDTKVDTSDGRFPYAMIFYRASNDAILDVLYTKETQAGILNSWSSLPAGFSRDPQLWEILIDAIADPSSPEMFKNYSILEGSFRWPQPDNLKFYVPFETTEPLSENNPAGGLCAPFNESFALNAAVAVYGSQIPGRDLVRMAIQQSFTPLNEQPPVAANIKSGKKTSPVAATIRDANGYLLDPSANDLYPMVKQYTDNGDTFMRFTDYTLDGASLSLYFYRAMEMDNKLKLSPPSPTLGPVMMVNSAAPEKPQIRKTVTQLPDEYLELPSAIVFELNKYAASEKISKLEIYRTTDELDALSVRTMKKVKTITWGEPVADDFSDVDFPLYGEQLYYRLVAIREVEDITDVLNSNVAAIIDVPSKPSDIVKATLVDPQNPEAPELGFIIGNTTATAFEEVQIVWSATCYNGTYSLQKMNNSGNWTEIYKVKQPEGILSYPPLVNGDPDFDTFTATVNIPRQDENDVNIYHRYRVVVENSSGLFNLVQKEYILDEYILAQQNNGTIDLEDNSGSIIL